MTAARMQASAPLELNHPLRNKRAPLKQAFPYSHHRIARAGREGAAKVDGRETGVGA